MLEELHNENSKKFMKKILIFIDSVFVNSGKSTPEDLAAVLTGGMLNIRDAIFSEIVRDAHSAQINQILTDQESKKNQENLNLEKKSENDQPQ